jgi:hypothetical protein
MPKVLFLCFTLVCVAFPRSGAVAQVTVYHDRGVFTAALAGLPPFTTDTYETYAPGPISSGDARGDFRYTFDLSTTQPAVVSDGAGGQALGGSPFDVFVGGDSVTLTLVSGHVLRAFGADFYYAPSFDAIPADTYRLGIADGPAAGAFAGNPDSIDPNGGSFFLGLIAAQGYEFAGAALLSVQQDPGFLVPAYQADNLIYAAVPEAAGFALPTIGFLTGCLVLWPARRRIGRRSQ